jgi:hypothetical protein
MITEAKSVSKYVALKTQELISARAIGSSQSLSQDFHAIHSCYCTAIMFRMYTNVPKAHQNDDRVHKRAQGLVLPVKSLS